ncbi:MAG: hypothetical protein ABEH88_09785 [Halobacteriales archaeon]
MRTVRDDAGRRYLLLKESAEACLIRDPDTGEERYVENERLTRIGQSPLVTAAERLSTETHRRLDVGPDERVLGLLSELDRRGPLAVRTILADYDVCESDLHGMLGELRAAGAIEEASVAGERGYGLTDATQEILNA